MSEKCFSGYWQFVLFEGLPPEVEAELDGPVACIADEELEGLPADKDTPTNGLTVTVHITNPEDFVELELNGRTGTIV